METIRLEKLLPLVFAGMDCHSEIWLEETLEFRPGCRVCIQAESGAGKSSLLSFIYGNRSDYSGQVFFDSRNIRSLSDAEWADVRRREIALLPQEMRLFPELTVWENIDIKNSLTDFKSRKDIVAMLEMLGIADKITTPCARLSIGQQQRVALIRTLCQPFRFILLDEPVSHLDAANNRLIADLVDREATAQGAGVITTSVGNPLLLPCATSVNL